MKINIKYTITEIMPEDSDNWDFPKENLSVQQIQERVLEEVKKTLQEDPSYVFDGLNYFSIKAEITDEPLSSQSFISQGNKDENNR